MNRIENFMKISNEHFIYEFINKFRNVIIVK